MFGLDHVGWGLEDSLAGKFSAIFERAILTAAAADFQTALARALSLEKQFITHLTLARFDYNA
jgi:hypothetical protein